MEQLDKGIIGRVLEQELSNEDSHFISHNCVIREDKSTTKVRVVFEGSACSKENSISLKNRLEVCESFFPWFQTLLRFRLHAVAGASWNL